MRVKHVNRLLHEGGELVEIQLVNSAGMILESIQLGVRDGKVILPRGYSPTVQGALDYGRAIWARWLPPEERPF